MLALRRMAGVAAFGLLASSCTLLSWGNNGFGQLGDGTTTQRTSPTPFAELPNWNTVAAGDSSTCATGTDATLWCWGLNNAGQLGDGTQDGHKSPHEVTTPSTDWDTVRAGHWFACATTTLDDLWCWGDNVNGQLGDGTTTRRFSPVQIGPSGGWTSVAPGYAHTCAVDWLSQLWCWGENDEGQVGNGASGADVLTPTLVAGSASWDSVAAGDGHTCGLQTDGTLWCWGDGDFGKLGQGVNLANSTTPLQVGSASDWEAVEAGDDHVCGVTTGGDLWCWGRSTKGQVGNGTAGVSVLAPAQIGSGTTWLSVELGREHSCATSAGDDLWCWGDASRGRLAQPSGGASYFTTPMQVPGPTNWSAVTSGAEHGCGITANDLLQCWGHNHVAQLGLGYGGILEDSPVPLDPAWISLAGGSSHSCRVGANGTLWCWGRNNAGQLGQGPGAGDSSVPVALGIIEWDQVAAGGDTTCAIRAGDHLRCWGAGTFGQIGDDEATDRDYPTEVIPSTGWAQVDTSGAHTCAVRTDATLWCWGRNTRGQVGDVTTTQRNVPTQVGTASDWASVTTGSEFTCAVTTGGLRSCWGRNAEGQFGNASTTDSLTPTSVPGRWKQLAGGNGHSCGIRTSGELYCSGVGVFGQLGNGATGSSTVPVQVGTANNWTDIDTGDFHSCGITADGISNTLRCWGANYNGQLGDGTTTDRSTPVIAAVGLLFDVATGGNHTFAVEF